MSYPTLPRVSEATMGCTPYSPKNPIPNNVWFIAVDHGIGGVASPHRAYGLSLLHGASQTYKYVAFQRLNGVIRKGAEILSLPLDAELWGYRPVNDLRVLMHLLCFPDIRDVLTLPLFKQYDGGDVPALKTLMPAIDCYHFGPMSLGRVYDSYQIYAAAQDMRISIERERAEAETPLPVPPVDAAMAALVRGAEMLEFASKSGVPVMTGPSPDTAILNQHAAHLLRLGFSSDSESPKASNSDASH